MEATRKCAPVHIGPSAVERTVSVGTDGAPFKIKIPAGAVHIRAVATVSGNGENVSYHVECSIPVDLIGPPAPCGLVDPDCDDPDDYWTPRADLLTYTTWEPVEVVG